MKYIYSLICLLITSPSLKAQTIPKDTLTGKFSYTSSVSLKSISKEELYTRATNWFEGAKKMPLFTRARPTKSLDGKHIDSLSFKSEADGIISHRAAIVTSINYNGYTQEMLVLFTISIKVKNESYIYEITGFGSTLNEKANNWTNPFEMYDAAATTQEGINKKIKLELFGKTDKEIKIIINGIKSAMAGLAKK